MTLGVGEFAGRVAESDDGFFKMKLKPISAYNTQLHHNHIEQLPIVHENVDVDTNFKSIQQEITQLTSAYRHT